MCDDAAGKSRHEQSSSIGFRRRRSWHPRTAQPTPARCLELLRRAYLGRRLAGLLVVAIISGPAPAAPESEIGSAPGAHERATPEQIQSGSLLLRMRSGYRIATRINSDVAIVVSGITVRATLKQEFRNDGAEWVEGVYVFPLPDGAAVDRMRLRVGERFIEGEIREKHKAKAEYEKAKAEGKRASLVNQQRANLFTTAVANIGPGQTVSIEIEYLDTARYDEGTFSLRFPMTMTPRYIPGHATGDRKGSGWSADTHRVPDASLITPPAVTASADHRVALHAVIDSGLPLEFVASRYHPINVDEVGDRYEVRFAQSGVAMDHDFELIWRAVKDGAPRARLFAETIDDQPHLLIMLVPPTDDAAPAVVLPRDLVFVIDTSGSMHGTSLEQAKRALQLAIDGLRPVDRFNIIQFNSVTRSLYSHSVTADAANLAVARQYVNALTANGGTEMRPALERALTTNADGKKPSHLRQVIFITDGSVGNESELFKVIERRLGEARLFTVGIGSAPNGWFMHKAAAAGRGTYVFISALHEVEEKMDRLVRKLERPQVTDIVVEWPSDLEALPYPETVPDLYAGEPVVIKARLARSPRAGDQLVIRGRSSSGDWGVELGLDVNRSSPGTAAVWGRAHIASLVDRERRGAEPAAVRQAIVATALRYHLVSKYTSLVAVDKTPVRPAAAGIRKEQVPNLLPHGQSHRAIFGFPATATNAPALRRTGSLCLLLATLLLFNRVWTVRGRGRAPG